MLCRCVDVVWSQLGLTRSHDHGKGDVQLKSKMATGNFQCFSKFMSQIFTIIAGFYHKYCWIILYSCQIKDYTSIKAGGKASK